MLVVVAYAHVSSEFEKARRSERKRLRDQRAEDIEKQGDADRESQEREDEERRQKILEANTRLSKWEGREPTPLEEQLGRGERTLTQWVDDLRRSARAAEHSFRAPQVPKVELWAIVEDVDAYPEVRVAAAITLGTPLNDAERTRLHEASQTLKSRNVRIAMDAVADHVGDDEGLIRSLEGLEE